MHTPYTNKYSPVDSAAGAAGRRRRCLHPVRGLQGTILGSRSLSFSVSISVTAVTAAG
jgi:hypothetical protein